MTQLANRLAITGILQHKSTAVTQTIVNTNLGEGAYTGFVPTATSVALPITVSQPLLGEGTYTGFVPTATTVEPWNLTYTSNQVTYTGDTPWRVTYYVYSESLVLQETVVHDLNMGSTPPISVVTENRVYNTSYIPYYIDVQVQRRTETFGSSPRNNRANAAGSVTWHKEGVGLSTVTFLINQRFNTTFPIENLFESGMEIGVTIYEG